MLIIFFILVSEDNRTLTHDQCPVLEESGVILTNITCINILPSVCVLKHCHAGTRDCCKMTRVEAWDWETRVQGRSVVLRPGVSHVYQEEERGELPVYWILVWLVFGSTIVCLISVRVHNQFTQERRYEAYNANREKY